MIDKIKKAFLEATEMIKEQASTLGEGAKEKSYQVIEEWLKVFPQLEINGLEVTSFALSVALSPALEVELKGSHKDFTEDKVNQIIEENRKSTGLLTVMNTIKTTYALHRKTYANLNDPLIVKVKIRLSPEIKVYIGQPLIE